MDDALRLRLNAIIALQGLTAIGVLGPYLMEVATGITTLVVAFLGFVAIVATVAYLLVLGLRAAVSGSE